MSIFMYEKKSNNNISYQYTAPAVVNQNILTNPINNAMTNSKPPAVDIQRQVERLLNAAVIANTPKQASPEDVERLLQILTNKVKAEKQINTKEKK